METGQAHAAVDASLMDGELDYPVAKRDRMRRGVREIDEDIRSLRRTATFRGAVTAPCCPSMSFGSCRYAFRREGSQDRTRATTWTWRSRVPFGRAALTGKASRQYADTTGMFPPVRL